MIGCGDGVDSSQSASERSRTLSRNRFASIRCNPHELFFQISSQSAQKRQGRSRFNQAAKGPVAYMNKAGKTFHGPVNSNGRGDVWPVEQRVAGNGFSGVNIALQHIFQVVDNLVAQAPILCYHFPTLHLTKPRAASV